MRKPFKWHLYFITGRVTAGLPVITTAAFSLWRHKGQDNSLWCETPFWWWVVWGRCCTTFHSLHSGDPGGGWEVRSLIAQDLVPHIINQQCFYWKTRNQSSSTLFNQQLLTFLFSLSAGVWHRMTQQEIEAKKKEKSWDSSFLPAFIITQWIEMTYSQDKGT